MQKHCEDFTRIQTSKQSVETNLFTNSMHSFAFFQG